MDTDPQTIYHYVDGLHRHIQQKLVTYKITMRTVGGNPSWDFSSLTTTINLAITIGTEPIYSQRPQLPASLPLHLQRSALANPDSTNRMIANSNKTKLSEGHVPTTSLQKVMNLNCKRTPHLTKEGKKCQYHPNSKTHTTQECRTKGGNARDAITLTPTLRIMGTAPSTLPHNQGSNPAPPKPTSSPSYNIID